MKTFSFNQFAIEVSIKSISALLFSVLILITSVFAVLHGAKAESELNQNIYVALDLTWMGGLVLVTLYCLFVKKREREVVATTQVSFGRADTALPAEPEVDYSYINMCNQ